MYPELTSVKNTPTLLTAWWWWWWWCMPLIPELRRQRQVDLCESEASLVYKFQDCQGYTEKPCLGRKRVEGEERGKLPENGGNQLQHLSLY